MSQRIRPNDGEDGGFLEGCSGDGMEFGRPHGIFLIVFVYSPVGDGFLLCLACSPTVFSRLLPCFPRCFMGLFGPSRNAEKCIDILTVFGKSFVRYG